MKIRKWICILSIGFLALSSCKKDDENGTESLPLIATETSDGITSTFSYINGRLDKIVDNDNFKTTFTYETSKVTVSEFESDGTLSYSEIYTLNSKGLAISSTSAGKKKKSGNITADRLMLKNCASTTATYEYDANGYMTKVTMSDGSTTSSSTLVITDGNPTSGTATSEGFTFNMLFAYFTDKTNTIGQENEGITFLGKQSKNLLKSATVSFIGYSSSTNYVYEYDSKNRVTKQTETDSDGNSYMTTYTYNN